MGSRSGVDADLYHYCPKAKVKGDYPIRYKFPLVTKLSHLREIFESANGVQVLGLDTEASSLNHEEAFWVGFSFCFDKKEAYYVPLAHIRGNIDDPEGAVRLLESFLQGKLVLFFNTRFDHRILETRGINTSADRFKSLDVAILVWFMDTNLKHPDLKWAAMHFLGWSMASFEETTGGMGFQYLDPGEGTRYAASDALATFHLYSRLATPMKEFATAVRIDNRVLPVIKQMEEDPIYVDSKYLESLSGPMNAQMSVLRSEVCTIAGTMFNPDSPEQVGQVLVENGIAPAERTPTGKVVTNEKVLSRIKHPLVTKLLEYKSLRVLHNSYVKKLIVESERKKGHINVSVKTTEASTGRLATGSDAKNAFFSKVNIQSIPTPDTVNYRLWTKEDTGVDMTFGNIKLVLQEKGPIEAPSPYLNVRKAFIPPQDYVWISIDFKGIELRLAAIFSKEPTLLNAYLNGVDVHSAVAAAVFGPNFTYAQRKVSKILSFGLLFGGSKYTIQVALNCLLMEAEEYENKYVAGHPVLYRWKNQIVNVAKRKGYVTTYFQRPRRVARWLTSPNHKDRAFGFRSVISSRIQGTAADVMKLAMINLARTVSPKFAGRMQLVSTVHDEVNIYAHKDCAIEIALAAQEAMTLKMEDWPIPLSVDLEMGSSWGELLPMTTKDGRIYLGGTDKELVL